MTDLDDLQRHIADRVGSMWLYTSTPSGVAMVLWLVGDSPAVVVRVGAVVQVLTTRRLRSATGRELTPAEAAAMVATWRKTARPDAVTVNGWRSDRVVV